MIERETWVLLAERCAEIRRVRALAELKNDVVLVYDYFDQAIVMERES